MSEYGKQVAEAVAARYAKEDSGAMRTANHQLVLNAEKAKGKFTRDQLAAAGLAKPQAPSPSRGNEISMEEAIARGLVRPSPPPIPLDDTMDRIEEQARTEVNGGRFVQSPPLVYEQLVESARGPIPEHPAWPPEQAPPHPPTDPMVAMVQQLMQQNAMLQQQLMQLTQQLANGGASQYVDPAEEQRRRAERVREGNLTPQQAEQVLYSGHGLIG